MNEFLKRFLANLRHAEYAQHVAVEDEVKLTSSVKGDTTEIVMYGAVGNFFEGVKSKDVITLLDSVTTNKIVVRLNSPGGEFNEGIAIYNALKNHEAHVTIIIEGYALSVAADIAAAGDEVIIREGSLLMVHCAMTPFIYGNANDLEKEIVVLRKHDEAQIDILSKRMSIEREEIQQLLNNETWFSAKEAVQIGFATSEIEENRTNAEAYKQSVLAKFKPKPVNKDNVLEKIKRNSME